MKRRRERGPSTLPSRRAGSASVRSRTCLHRAAPSSCRERAAAAAAAATVAAATEAQRRRQSSSDGGCAGQARSEHLTVCTFFCVAQQ